jgi:hypothetical protein
MTQTGKPNSLPVFSWGEAQDNSNLTRHERKIDESPLDALIAIPMPAIHRHTLTVETGKGKPIPMQMGAKGCAYGVTSSSQCSHWTVASAQR